MRKLKLDPEELTVESFATDRIESLYGTVRGAQDGVDTVEGGEIVEPEPGDATIIIIPPSMVTCFTRCDQLTCRLSCAGTCWYDQTCNSCYGTCPTGVGPDCCA